MCVNVGREGEKEKGRKEGAMDGTKGERTGRRMGGGGREREREKRKERKEVVICIYRRGEGEGGVPVRIFSSRSRRTLSFLSSIPFATDGCAAFPFPSPGSTIASSSITGLSMDSI
jgi:hypothetical protein